MNSAMLLMRDQCVCERVLCKVGAVRCNFSSCELVPASFSDFMMRNWQIISNRGNFAAYRGGVVRHSSAKLKNHIRASVFCVISTPCGIIFRFLEISE